jgi:hypothetical protein
MGARKILGVACLENFSRGGCGHRFKVYPIAEPLNPLGQPIDRIMPPPFVEVVRAQLVIRFLTREHVKDTDHDGVGHCHDRTLLPPTRRQASIQGRPRGLCRPGSCLGQWRQAGTQGLMGAGGVSV